VHKIALSFIATLMLVAPVSAARAKASASTASGYDISYPQCNGAYPTNTIFAVVGVNNGKASTFNPCFASELAWANAANGTASQPKAQIYVNTGNPGDVLAQYNVTTWPTSSIAADPYGTCSGTYTNNSACAWEYGYERAQADLSQIGSATYRIWLDVETGNSWSNNLAENQADLEGMIYSFNTAGVPQVGIYSNSYQLGQITGTVSSTSSLNGLKDWIPGATSLSGAQSNCHLAPLTAGGQVTITQYTGTFDKDYSCI
jgi:hypothetical protein